MQSSLVWSFTHEGINGVEKAEWNTPWNVNLQQSRKKKVVIIFCDYQGIVCIDFKKGAEKLICNIVLWKVSRA